MTRFFVGTSGWSYDHWKGDFYPQELPRRGWFAYYAGQFNAVEINATFYGWFKDSTYEKWREQSPTSFCYVLKAPRQITHRKYLSGVNEDIRNFWHSAALLEGKLGMILLQLAPGQVYEPERLRQALLAFPDPRKVAVEFRGPQWETPEVEELLRHLDVTYANADYPGHPLTTKLTSASAYLRMHGRRRWYADDYSEEELQALASQARGLAGRDAERVFIFFNNDIGGFAPRNAERLAELLE